MDNYFARLNQINVSEHLEKKNSFNYLSWPFAVAQLRLADPTATWEVRRFDGLPFLKTETGYFVEVAVTVQGITLSQIHPVLDGKNRPIVEPTAFDINTSIQRCLVKAIALHGLGLYVYAGRGPARGRGSEVDTTEGAGDSDQRAADHAGAAALHRAADRRDRQRPRQGPGLLRRHRPGRAQQPRGEPRHHLTREEPEGRMSTIMKLVQGSAEWHEHRRSHRNASETAAVLGLSPFMTPYQLWQIKLGLVASEVTPAMLHGTQLEPQARAAYEALTGHVMQPLVLVDGEYSASLDGMTLGGERIVEIKVPFRGRESTLWKSAAEGRVPEHYGYQIQHQMMVAGAEVADFYVFDGAEGLLLEVKPQPETWPQIRAAWDAFMQCVREGHAPPLTARDTKTRDDAEWLSAAAAYLEAKRAADTTGESVG